MLVDSTNIEIQRQGCAAKLVMRSLFVAVETKLTAADLDALMAYLQREATTWREACAMDYYRVLGIDRTASVTEIRRAYRKLAKQFHPDASSENTGAAMEKLNQAYAVLGDPASRQEYNRTL